MSSTATPSARKILPKTSVCVSRLAALVIRDARRAAAASASARLTSVITSPAERPATFALDVDHRVAVEVVDRPPGRCPGVIVATWPSGTVRRRRRCAARRPPAAAAARSAARCRASGASRTMTSRVSPLGSTQSPASMPANAGRSDCATWPTVSPSEPARPRLRSTVELGLLALGREPDVHRARHLLHHRRAPARPPR